MRSTLSNAAAFASVFTGLLAGAWLWRFPYLGLPVAIGGIIFGFLARKSDRQNIALAGMIFSMLALFLVLVNLGTAIILKPGTL